MLVALKTPLRLGGSPRWTQEARRAEGDAPGRRRRGFQPLGFNCESCDSALMALMRHALENKLWLHKKVTRLVNTVSFGLDIGDSKGTALISWNPYWKNLQFWLFSDSPSWCWSRKDCEMHQACPRVWVAGSSLSAMRWNSKSKKHHVLSSIKKTAMRQAFCTHFVDCLFERLCKI